MLLEAFDARDQPGAFGRARRKQRQAQAQHLVVVPPVGGVGVGEEDIDPRLGDQCLSKGESHRFAHVGDAGRCRVGQHGPAIGREGEAAQKLLDNKLVQATKAWRSKQVVYLNAANWYLLSNASPGALRANIQQLSNAFARG